MTEPWHHPKRACAVLTLIGVLCVLLLGRTLYIQWYNRDHYITLAAAHTRDVQEVRGDRGRILDRMYRVLAQSVPASNIAVSPRAIQEWATRGNAKRDESVSPSSLRNNPNLRNAARVIALELELPFEEVLDKLCGDGEFLPLAQRVAADSARRLEELDIPGLAFEDTGRREYPLDTLACAVIGHCNVDQKPESGAEKWYRLVTEGETVCLENRYAQIAKLLGGRLQDRATPNSGKDVVLTLDLACQQIVETELDRCVTVRDPVGANVVVMSTHDGSILAMSCRPNFDPNYISKAKVGKTDTDPDSITNRPVSSPMEPGSTFKLLTIACALECGAITEQTTFHCTGSELVAGPPKVNCWGEYRTRGHGTVNASGILAGSCNVGAAKVAIRIGPRRFHEFLTRCGIGSKPLAGFPAESGVPLTDPGSIVPRDLAAMGFGQGVSVTDLQLTSAVTAILNGGSLYQPHIAQGYLCPITGETYEVEPRIVRRVCSLETSRIVCRLMADVVEKGTGRTARIPGFAVGGKTGTAQIFDHANNSWFAGPRDYLMSFILAAPVDRRPDFVVLVTVDRPKVGLHGSDVAAPIARRVAEHLLRRQGLFPKWSADSTPADTPATGRPA